MKILWLKRLPGCLLFLLMLVLSLTGAQGKDQELQSQWRDHDIVMDGRDNEWKGPILTKEKLSIQMCNDDSNAYFCFTTKDRAVKSRVLAMGMTLWLNKGGGNEKVWGIHFPLALKDKKEMPRPTAEIEDKDSFEEKIVTEKEQIELLYPGQEKVEQISLKDAEASGIDVRLQCKKEKLVYELKIPLSGPKVFPLDLKRLVSDTGTAMTIGIESPALWFRGEPEKDIEYGSESDRGSRRASGSGGLAVMRDTEIMKKPLDFWIQVKLASPGK